MKLILKILTTVFIVSVFTLASAVPQLPIINFLIVSEAGDIISGDKNSLKLSGSDIDCVRFEKHVNKIKNIEFSLFNQEHSSPNPDFGKVSYVFSADLTQVGGDKLEKFTQMHKGERLQMSLDTEILSTETIQAPIGRYFQISGIQPSVFSKLKPQFFGKSCHANSKNLS